MSANRVQKISNRPNKGNSKKRSSTERRRIIAEYNENFGFAMTDCSRCKRLSLECKVSDRSVSCSSCLRAGVSPCDAFGLPTSTLRVILEEKRRLDREKRETLAKLLRLEAQSRALEGRAEAAFTREVEVLEAEEREASAVPASEPPAPEGVNADVWFPSFDVDWANLDPSLLVQAGQDFAGGTAGASPGSSGTQTAPTS
jgi:hypothetical protein